MSCIFAYSSTRACGKATGEGEDYCHTHRQLCWACLAKNKGSQANHSCGEACGIPLCEDHTRCAYHLAKDTLTCAQLRSEFLASLSPSFSALGATEAQTSAPASA